MTKKVAAH